MVLIVVAAISTLRFGVLTPQGRMMLEARGSGLKLGSIGKLKIEGLGGDIWRDFTIRRLTISDEKGVWFEANRVRLHWSYAELVFRRLRIDDATAETVRVLRRPSLAPKGPPSNGLPVTFEVRAMKFRLETLPAFSTRRGLFDVAGALSVERGDLGQAAAVTARSLLHPGDLLDLRFDIGRTRPLHVAADATEARGGAIAGALGLAADKPFKVTARADGSSGSGRIDLELTSGASRPAWAHGGWSAAGGVISGKASLAASSLTARYVRMVGPDVVFAVAGRRARDGLYGVAGDLKAQNLALKASGPADPSKFSSSQGLALAIAVPSLTRIVPRPAMGAGRAQGLLVGDLRAWSFKGSAVVQAIDLGGYRLAGASGPVSVSASSKQLQVQAAMKGTGGQGRGTLAGLAGAAPLASVDLSRLADGRLLIRKANAQGAGFRLDAHGDRSLLGGLDFAGKLELPNLALARSDAAGALAAHWTAAQSSATKPWRLSADATGRDFRSGLPELDRLLGGAPRLRVTAALASNVFLVSSAALDGAKASASAQGTVDVRGPLALKTTWRAQGPFQAGPVLISGDAKGEGAVTGSLDAPRADLAADFAALDIPNLPVKAAHVHLTFVKAPSGLDGAIGATGKSEYGPARAAAAFRFVPGGVDLTGIDTDAGGIKASGALSLRGSAPSSADLTLAVGPGAVLSAGRITGTVRIVDSGAPTAAVDLAASGAAFRGAGGTFIRTARLNGSGPLGQLPFQVSGEAQTAQGPFSLNGSGVYRQSKSEQDVTLVGTGKFRGLEVRTLQPAAFRLAKGQRSLRLRLAVGSGQLDLDSQEIAGTMTSSASLRGVDIKALAPDFTGTVDADIALQGRGDRLGGTANGRLHNARSLDAPAEVAIDATIKALLEDTRLTVQAQASGAKGLAADFEMAMPVEASASPLHIAIIRNRPIQGRLTANGEIKPLWDLVYGGDRELSGQTHLAGKLDGTLNDLQVTGQAAVTGGRFQDAATGLVLTNLALNADLKRDVVTLQGFSAKDEKSGAVTGSGSISLVRGGGSSLKLELQRFRLLDNDTAEATASGQVVITRAPEGPISIVGGLDLDRAQINAETKLRPSVVTMAVVERNGTPSQQALMSAPAARGPPITLNVTLRAPRRVFVKGRGIDAELSLDAHVTGNLASPDLEGTARVVQGSYDFAGKRFDFDERGVITLATTPERMRLDLSASWEAPSLTATVNIKGTAARPEITLTSAPSLPQEEILSQVLFGSSAAQLSGPETAELASTVTALATGGGFDVLGSLKQFAGLDRLALGGNDVTGMTVAGGKYLGDNVYLEIVGGGREGPTAEVDWRIRRGLSVLSQIGGQIGAKLSIRWSHDLGKTATKGGKGARR